MKRYLVLLSVCLLFLFVGFSKAVKHDIFTRTDFDVTVKIQDRMPGGFDEFWEDSAFFVSPVPSLFLAGILTVIGGIDWKAKRLHWRISVIPILFIILTVLEIYGKSVVHHPSPPFFMLKNPTAIFPKYHIIEQFSYPSGHAARSSFLAICLFFLIIQPLTHLTMRNRMFFASAAAFYVVLVCIGRIYLGHHWLSDIVGGALLGSALGTAYGAIAYNSGRNTKR